MKLFPRYERTTDDARRYNLFSKKESTIPFDSRTYE